MWSNMEKNNNPYIVYKILYINTYTYIRIHIHIYVYKIARDICYAWQKLIWLSKMRTFPKINHHHEAIVQLLLQQNIKQRGCGILSSTQEPPCAWELMETLLIRNNSFWHVQPHLGHLQLLLPSQRTRTIKSLCSFFPRYKSLLYSADSFHSVCFSPFMI